MLHAISDDIWTTDGDTLDVMGFHYPTRAVIIRLGDGSLLIWSPITLTNDVRAQIDALGIVTQLIAPNSLHHLALPDWQAAYPNAKLHGNPALIRKRSDLRFDGTLDATADPAWQDVMEQIVLENRIATEVVFHHKPSRTTIFTDILQQFPPGFHKGWRSIIARLDLMTGTRPNVPRKFRLGFGNRKIARESVSQILNWPTRNLIMAHGDPVIGDGQVALSDAFAWLIK